MTKTGWTISITICLILFGLVIFGRPSKYKTDPAAENTSEKLVANITRLTMSQGKPHSFNQGSADEGTAYSSILYSGYAMYEVVVHDYNNGKRGLSVSHYKTNVDFDSMENPADIVAGELIYGRPTIAIEEHMFTDRTDGRLTMYQLFMKRKGSMFMGFTRKERDLGKKAGVTETILDNDEILENDKWRKASAEEIAELQAAYLEHLKEVLRYLEKASPSKE